MDHAVRAAGQHEVGIAVADQLGSFPNGLAAGGAGGQAVVIRAQEIEIGSEMGGRRVQLLLELTPRVERAQTGPSKRRRIHVAALRLIALAHQGNEIVEILNPFSRAEVNSETRTVHLLVFEETGVRQGLLRGTCGEPAIGARIGPPLRLAHVFAEVEALHLRRESCRKSTGIEKLDGAHTASAFDLGLKQLVHAVSEGCDYSHAGDDDAFFHIFSE
jgi:hypothetical protein